MIIEQSGGIILIQRKNRPFGWALPGGFIDYGEAAEEAAKREAREETSLELSQLKQFHTYSAADRDPRFHTISLVFIAKGEGKAKAADDAKNIGLFGEKDLPDNIAFDHRQILKDYFLFKAGENPF